MVAKKQITKCVVYPYVKLVITLQIYLLRPRISTLSVKQVFCIHRMALCSNQYVLRACLTVANGHCGISNLQTNSEAIASLLIMSACGYQRQFSNYLPRAISGYAFYGITHVPLLRRVYFRPVTLAVPTDNSCLFIHKQTGQIFSKHEVQAGETACVDTVVEKSNYERPMKSATQAKYQSSERLFNTIRQNRVKICFLLGTRD